MKVNPDISIDLCGIRMKNPVMVASGTFGYGPEYAELLDISRLGAIVVKGISLEPTQGNPTPRLLETPCGLLNAIGLQNPGADEFIKEYMPFLRKHDVALIVNIWGREIQDYAEVAARFDSVPGVHALELNISCPNIKQGGLAFGSEPRMAHEVTAAARARTRLPLIPKLPPNSGNISLLARAVAEAGADAISLINSFPAMAIDVERRVPLLANVTGGLSGPAIHPIAVKLVWEAAQAVKLPVIGIGGITSAKDALEFIIAGASAVAVGTANFTEPATCLSIIDGIGDYLRRHNLASIAELKGSLTLPGQARDRPPKSAGP